MNTKIKILAVFVLAISIGLFVFLRLYNKPHVNVEETKAELITTTESILEDYQSDEVAANEKYADNIVQISGIISDISFENGNSIITLKNPDGLSSVICHMLPEENIHVLKLKKESSINIKGICTGYLLDVMMVRCVLVN